MIQKIRNSRWLKGVTLLITLSIFLELVYPNQVWALTGGPAQPEFNSFTPIGTSDMVDLSSGDVNYNIPLMDVGGYPLNLAYSGGVTMDQEASWVGLGWDLAVGQINRNVRGIPDDFDGDKGDKLTYHNYMKPNVTVGASFKFTPAAFGVTLENIGDGNIYDGGAGDSSYAAGNTTIGVSAMYNNYNGFSMKPSLGISLDLGKAGSVGFNGESGSDGISISPSISLHAKKTSGGNRTNKLGMSYGVSMNSRQGLQSTSLNMTTRATYDQKKDGGKTGLKSSGSVGSSISFADQIYTPTKRVGMSTQAFTVNAALGGEFFGGEGQGQVTAYGTVMKVADNELEKQLPAYGYMNSKKVTANGVMDFNREKDGNFGVNSTNLPITNYTYDIYSVKGQGVSGMYRAYRNQVGFVTDAEVNDGSRSFALGLEFGVGNAAHSGADFEATLVNSQSGIWNENNSVLPFLKENGSYPVSYEKYHLKNVGDLSADLYFEQVFSKIGNYDPTRVAWNVNGSKFNRVAQAIFKHRHNLNGNEDPIHVTGKIHRQKRQMRNQTIVHLTVDDLNNGIGFGPCVQRNGSAEYTVSSGLKGHHVAEVQILRNDGARYVYGLPAVNKRKEERTFSVNNNGDCLKGLVSYDQNDVNNPDNLPNDKFLDGVTTPAYVHTHLLTSVLSTDYQDRTNNGPSPDDFGSYTKFSYSKMNDDYKWRVPFEKNMATYNEGLKTDERDQRGNYIYGVKEQYLVSKIETKTHVAIFKYSKRKDARGVSGESGGGANGAYSYKLDKISLYSIEEYDLNSQNGIPIKEVHFEYDYTLCPGVPNNLDASENGKLTLNRLYFTYRNSKMGKYTDYEFSYSNINPVYNINDYDSWGRYKPNTGGCLNSEGPVPREFPYSSQDKSIQDPRSEAWCLKKIDLPSGGAISISYESDDYMFVQNKEAMRMFKVAGVGWKSNGIDAEEAVNDANESTEIYGSQLLNKATTYIYMELDESETATNNFQYVKRKYLKDLIDQPIYFRFYMNTTQLGGTESANENVAKYDYVTGYFEYEEANTGSGYDGDSKIFETGGEKYLSIPVKLVKKEGGLFPVSNKVSPFSKATWSFGRKYLNKHIYSAQPNGDTGGGNAGEEIEAIVADMLSPNTLNNLIEIFTGPNATLENKNVGRRLIKKRSCVRLSNPNYNKLGGGNRVKEIRMSDVWQEMNLGQGNYQTMNFGQKYAYQLPSGASSGVATYEPVGNKENPFVQPVPSHVDKLLAPDEENYIEKPFGESFFPSPTVTYSRVSVSNLDGGVAPESGMRVKRLHKTGHVVTEFYTSKDYPTIVDQTILEAEEDKQEALANILNVYSRKHFTASQGYTIHLNDMNGKQKAQWVYAEGQDAPISGVKYIYDNHETPNNFSASGTPRRAKGRLNNKVVVIHPDGKVSRETIGVEVDIVHDFRENSTVTEIPGVNANLATFFVGIIPGIVPVPLPDYSKSEDLFRSVSTTKVINTFGILKETIVFDAGASVSTRNLAWDASTGEVLLTETVDEFDDNYYTLNYPAHWYYDGMGQASKNIDFESSFSEILSGTYELSNLGSYSTSDFLIAGDELVLSNGQFAWISAVNGNQFKMIDENGVSILGATGKLRVIRSGHRNLQSAGIFNVTLMQNPLLDPNTNNLVNQISSSFLRAAEGDWQKWKVINAGAVDYSDNWAPPCECGIDLTNGTYNPFLMNAKGVWRTKSSRTYLTGRNSHDEVTPRQQGFFTSFAPMYQYAGSGGWVKDYNDWTFVAEVTKYNSFGREIENKDALNRYSAAQYGYNNIFPVAVGANTKYSELGFDGFEDYGFDGCKENGHFNFRESVDSGDGEIDSTQFHTGRHSIKVVPGGIVSMSKRINCPEDISKPKN